MPTDTLIVRTKNLAEGQCATTKSDWLRDAAALETAGDLHAANGLKQHVVRICECWPAELSALRERLSDDDLAAQWTEAEFVALYFQEVKGRCEGEMIKRVYSDSLCPQLAAPKPNPEAYCQCMADIFGRLSDIEITQLGMDNADWLPRAEAAKKQGFPEPEPPPSVKAFQANNAACSAP